MLLTASTVELPLQGRRAGELVKFGDSTLLLVMSPTDNLSGDLLARLPWMVGAVGALTTLGATMLVERLQRRRDQADALAAENQLLYTSQLSVARVLQQSLLPQHLPYVAGLGFDVRYVPGVEGLAIGGDWYDVVELENDRVLLVIGDVSGSGLQAGTTMGSLRYAIRAFASRGDDPSTVLTSLTRLLDVERDGHFATVMCAEISAGERTITIANAGHPNPVLIDSTGVSVIPTNLGPPIGVTRDIEYPAVYHTLSAGSTVLAFTDGLFERRGESINVGLDRLRCAVPTTDDGLGDLLDGLLAAQLTDDSHDDSAILGVRWTSQQTT